MRIAALWSAVTLALAFTLENAALVLTVVFFVGAGAALLLLNNRVEIIDKRTKETRKRLVALEETRNIAPTQDE